MDPLVIPLEQVGDEDTSLVGLKALRLAQMARNGLPVPSGFVVTTSAYRAFLKTSGLSDPTSAALRSAPVPPEVTGAVQAACQALAPGDAPISLAVRSVSYTHLTLPTKA